MKNIYCLFVMALVISACTSGSYTLTGKQHKPIDPSLVKIYADPPHKYKVIAIVSSRSAWGFDVQHEINDGVAELKRQAADLGANGIMSIKVEKKPQRMQTAIEITGQAVYVIKK